MESLYLLVPLSVGVILAMIGVFAWALQGGQFDDISLEGERMLDDGENQQPVRAQFDADQADKGRPPEE